MTRAEAFEAFFAAVDLLPHNMLAERTAIRNAGMDYAHAAVREVTAEMRKIVQATKDDRHLLDGVSAQTNQVTEDGPEAPKDLPLQPPYPDTLSPDDRASRRDDLRLDTQIYGGHGDDHDRSD